MNGVHDVKLLKRADEVDHVSHCSANLYLAEPFDMLTYE
jgi:hypothetical protein